MYNSLSSFLLIYYLMWKLPSQTTVDWLIDLPLDHEFSSRSILIIYIITSQISAYCPHLKKKIHCNLYTLNFSMILIGKQPFMSDLSYRNRRNHDDWNPIKGIIVLLVKCIGPKLRIQSIIFNTCFRASNVTLGIPIFDILYVYEFCDLY